MLLHVQSIQGLITSKRKPRRRSSERTVARGFVVLSKRVDTNWDQRTRGTKP
jgi:hypothetical protein